MLDQAGLPDKFWEDCAAHVVEVQNAMPLKAHDWRSPNHVWALEADENTADKTLQRTFVFGCEAWYYDHSPQLKKGARRARKAVYLGTSGLRNGWKMLDLETRKIIVTRDAYFNEVAFPYRDKPEERAADKVRQENERFKEVGDIMPAPSQPAVPVDPEPVDVPDAPPGDDGGAVPLDLNVDPEVPAGHYEVDEIVGKRKTRFGPRGQARVGSDYKVKWKPAGGVTYPDSWEHESHLVGAQDAVDEYNGEPLHVEDVALPQPNGPDDSDSEAVAVAMQTMVKISDDYKKMHRHQVKKTELWPEFQGAEGRELKCLKIHGTYRVVKRPKGRKPITCRWCYDVKRDADNNIVVYKARLVAHGFKQQAGVDYTETFSAVAQLKSFRLTVALSQLLGLRMTQIDISSAFLHGELEEDIYMEYPPGYPGAEGTCLKLQKGLYGLRQAGRIWNQKFVGTLKEMGFEPLVSDSQVLKLRRGKSFFIIGLHVDDATLSTNDENLRREVLKKLEEKFLVKDLGDLSYYLGIKVVKGQDTTQLLQDAYLQKVLERFNLADANAVPTPGAPGQQLSKEDCPDDVEEQRDMAKKPFRALVGSLMYAYVSSRPDIGAALTKVAAFCQNPGGPHWVAAKRVLRYLLGTINTAVTYRGRLKAGDKVQIRVYCDSDWAQDRDDRRSTSGWIVMVAGGPVSWKCKKQPTRAMSSCEAEFISLSDATKEVLWITYFLDELQIPYETPTIFTDSKSAIEWSKNACHHQRTKHVALKYFFVRDEVASRRVKVAYISTKDNVADLLTKNTTIGVYKYLQPKLMGLMEVAHKAWRSYVGKGVRRNLCSSSASPLSAE